MHKKTTKINPGNQYEKKVVEQEIKPPNDNDFSNKQDLDSKMKGIFVPIYFDYNKSDIMNSEIQKLERIASFLNENNHIRVQIEGNCDERGSEEYNMGLGENRAKSVQKWLVTYGIPQTRLETTSYGKERPAVSGCNDDECHSKNRRDEWKVLSD
jgi:peptidoglycan-associated lipoprotein